MPKSAAGRARACAAPDNQPGGPAPQETEAVAPPVDSGGVSELGYDFAFEPLDETMAASAAQGSGACCAANGNCAVKEYDTWRLSTRLALHPG